MKKDSKIVPTVKAVVTAVGAIGVGTIVSNAVKHVTPTSGVGAIMKVCIGVGTMLLGGIACDATTRYAEGRIDEAVSVLQAVESEAEETSEEEVTTE